MDIIHVDKILFYFIISTFIFRGHCLMGQLYEGMGQLEKAVASYRRYFVYMYMYISHSSGCWKLQYLC